MLPTVVPVTPDTLCPTAPSEENGALEKGLSENI
jgi:hypothetical protein